MLWSHPTHMWLMAWHVLNKHMSPSHCALWNLAYGHQNLWIVQSAIQNESLLKCHWWNIIWHNIASNGIKFFLFYRFASVLNHHMRFFFSSKKIKQHKQKQTKKTCQSFLMTVALGRQRQTDFKQTSLGFQYTSERENTLQTLFSILLVC